MYSISIRRELHKSNLGRKKKAKLDEDQIMKAKSDQERGAKKCGQHLANLHPIPSGVNPDLVEERDRPCRLVLAVQIICKTFEGE